MFPRLHQPRRAVGDPEAARHKAGPAPPGEAGIHAELAYSHSATNC